MNKNTNQNAGTPSNETDSPEECQPEILVFRPVDHESYCDEFNHQFEQQPTIIRGADELKEIVQYDHICSSFRGFDGDGAPLTAGQGYSNQDNWIRSRTLWADIDNAELPSSEWTELADLQATLDAKDLSYAIYTSKSHMRGKNTKTERETPRPKFHILVPLSRDIESREEMEKLMDLLRRFLETSREGAKKIVTCDNCWEVSRKFFGSGPKVQVSWKEGKNYFDELDLSELEKQAEEEIGQAAKEREGNAKKSGLSKLLGDFKGKKPGGRRVLVMQATESLVRRGMSKDEAEEIVKCFAETMEGTEEWDFYEGKFEEGVRWVERQCKKDETRLREAVEEYAKRFKLVWWGSQKVLYRIEDGMILDIAATQLEEDRGPEDRICWRTWNRSAGKYRFRFGSKFECWLDGAEKQHTTVTFDPSLPPGKITRDAFNLWNGFAVQPSTKGSWDKTRKFIEEDLANGDSSVATYLLDYLAQLVQQPQTLPEVAIFFGGAPGTGKGSWHKLIRGLVGDRNVALVNNTERVTGRFNSLLENKLYVWFDEALWAGSIHDRQVLKSLITESDEIIERKGLDSIKVKNYKRFGGGSNQPHYCPVEKNNRRYLCLQTSSKHAKDRVYFGEIWAELDAGGWGRMMYDLLQRDISKRVWADFPVNEETVTQMIYGFDKADALIHESLLTGGPIDFSIGFMTSGKFAEIWNDYHYKGYVAEQTAHQGRLVIGNIFGDLVKPKKQRAPALLGGLPENGIAFNGTLAYFRRRFAAYCGVPVDLLFPKNLDVLDSVEEESA